MSSLTSEVTNGFNIKKSLQHMSVSGSTFAEQASKFLITLQEDSYFKEAPEALTSASEEELDLCGKLFMQTNDKTDMFMEGWGNFKAELTSVHDSVKQLKVNSQSEQTIRLNNAKPFSYLLAAYALLTLEEHNASEDNSNRKVKDESKSNETEEFIAQWISSLKSINESNAKNKLRDCESIIDQITQFAKKLLEKNEDSFSPRSFKRNHDILVKLKEQAVLDYVLYAEGRDDLCNNSQFAVPMVRLMGDRHRDYNKEQPIDSLDPLKNRINQDWNEAIGLTEGHVKKAFKNVVWDDIVNTLEKHHLWKPKTNQKRTMMHRI